MFCSKLLTVILQLHHLSVVFLATFSNLTAIPTMLTWSHPNMYVTVVTVKTIPAWSAHVSLN